MSEPIRDEVELPNFDWERMAEVAADGLCTPEEHPDHETCMACLAIKGTRWALEVRNQLKVALSANREKDAEIAQLARKYLEEKSIVDRVWKALGISTYEQAEGKSIDEIVASLRASGGEKWIEIKEGCEMPEHGEHVWVIWNGVVQKMAYYRDIGEWVPFDRMSDSAPDGTFSHWMPIPAPPTLTREE